MRLFLVQHGEAKPESEIIRFRNAGIVRLSQKEGKWAIDWVMQPQLL
jgi:hypothetical protein